MSNAQQAVDQVLSAQFWARQRNRILGAAVILLLGVGTWHYVSGRSARTEGEGWEAVWQPTMQAYMPPVRPDADPDGPAKGTAAEPWALALRAQRAYADKDFDLAERSARRLVDSFPDHPRVRDGWAQRLLDDTAAEKAFVASHPTKSANPPVDAGKSVTLTTELGEIRVGLYPDQAPVAVRTFLEAIRATPTGWQVDEVARNGYAILSIPALPANEEKKDAKSEDDQQKKASALLRGVVPDRNRLSHFKGAVGIMRQSEADAAKGLVRLKIRVSLRDDPSLDDSEVVIGTVASGVEFLEQAATRDVKKGSRTLEKPLAISKFAEGADLASIH